MEIRRKLRGTEVCLFAGQGQEGVSWKASPIREGYWPRILAPLKTGGDRLLLLRAAQGVNGARGRPCLSRLPWCCCPFSLGKTRRQASPVKASPVTGRRSIYKRLREMGCFSRGAAGRAVPWRGLRGPPWLPLRVASPAAGPGGRGRIGGQRSRLPRCRWRGRSGAGPGPRRVNGRSLASSTDTAPWAASARPGGGSVRPA